MAHTRTPAPANGTPRELNTMSSLRVPCPCAGFITPGQTCIHTAKITQIIPLTVFDLIIRIRCPLRISSDPDDCLMRQTSVNLWFVEMIPEPRIELNVDLPFRDLFWAMLLMSLSALRYMLGF